MENISTAKRLVRSLEAEGIEREDAIRSVVSLAE